MTYNTILTSKGTTTIPAELRRMLGVEPGMIVSFTLDKKTGQIILGRPQTIEEVRAMNKVALAKAKTTDKQYRSGDGFTAHVREKFGDQQ